MYWRTMSRITFNIHIHLYNNLTYYCITLEQNEEVQGELDEPRIESLV